MLPSWVKDPASFTYGASAALLGGVFLMFASDSLLGWAFLAIGAVRAVCAFFFTWPETERGGKPGPGPLDPTPAKRFRATGWPPSKDPDEYR